MVDLDDMYMFKANKDLLM